MIVFEGRAWFSHQGKHVLKVADILMINILQPLQNSKSSKSFSLIVGEQEASNLLGCIFSSLSLSPHTLHHTIHIARFLARGRCVVTYTLIQLDQTIHFLAGLRGFGRKPLNDLNDRKQYNNDSCGYSRPNCGNNTEKTEHPDDSNYCKERYEIETTFL